LEKIIIAAVSANRVIGRNGVTPWHLVEELKHFKNTTTGFPVIMGKNTWETLKYPLENRLNIVLTRNTLFSFIHPNVVICNSIPESLSYCEKNSYSKIFFIGGGEIFKQTITIVDRMIISSIKLDFEGDCYFPEFDINEWELVTSVDKNDFVINEYLRR